MIFDTTYIKNLMELQTQENKSLDYKLDLGFDSEQSKISFCKDITSFANTEGGNIVIGVKEAADEFELVGIERDIDALESQCRQIIEAKIEPQIMGISFNKILCDEKKVVVIHVPKSWEAPHAIVHDHKFHFLIRNENKNTYCSYSQVKEMIMQSSNLTNRIRDFVKDRINKILNGEIYGVDPNATQIIFHLVPVEGFQRKDFVEIDSMHEQSEIYPDVYKVAIDSDDINNEHLLNLDGLLYFVPINNKRKYHRSSTQIFRDGVCELRCEFLSAKLDLQEMEFKALATINKLLDLLTSSFISESYFPLVIFASLINVEYKTLKQAGAVDADRNIMNLSDILVRSRDNRAIQKALQDIIKMGFNGFGLRYPS